MVPQRDPNKKNPTTDNNTDQKMNDLSSDVKAETTICKYLDDKDFDEAFKNLLKPLVSITKKGHCEPLQYNLLKELDSYLIHLKNNSDNDSAVFVEAAQMIQNVIFIYQKKVDQYIDVMTDLVAKFKAYRRNTGDYVEIEEGNKKKKKEKTVKLYPSFEPIKIELRGPNKIFDCKKIDLSKIPSAPKMILNANIKVDDKYNELLPYISVGNGENIGKKYDFKMNWPLNHDLAVNEEIDLSTNTTAFNYCLNHQNNNRGLPPMFMNVDEVNRDDKPDALDPVVFEQTINRVIDDVNVPPEEAVPSANTINFSKIPQITDDDPWKAVTDDDGYVDKPIVEKKASKKRDREEWLPSYTMSELFSPFGKTKSGFSPDPEFRQIIYKAQEAQRLEISKKRNERMKDEFECKGSDSDDVDYDFDVNFEDQEQQVNDKADNYQAFKKHVLDMERYEQNQLEIMNEQLAMRNRVQNWHDKLRPVLEAEAKRPEFDVHEYGTKMLECFEKVGEQKSFKDLVGGLEREEVARYYLSTLMMANTSNVKITSSVDVPDGEMKIELLNKERHHEQLQVNIGNQVNQDQK